MKRKVFYSFHFDNDVLRVQQIRNIGAIEGNQPVSKNKWEQIKRSGDTATKNWIAKTMSNKSCVIVLVGEETADSEWVQYEIKKAWNDGKGLFGIYIHNIKCPRTGFSSKGKNPFEIFKLNNGKKLSNIVSCYNPTPSNAYNHIKSNITSWIEESIRIRKKNP